MVPSRVIDYLPEWQCHKVVRGGKISQIKYNADGSAMLVIKLDPSIKNDVLEVAIKVGDSWMVKHNPSVGGYFVAYEDGYLSYSPADAFEGGYALK